jgi:hypothetical protein
MNFLVLCVCVWALLAWVLGPPPLWVVSSLFAVGVTTGVLLYVS